MAVKITAYILSAAMVLGSGISASAAVPNTQKDENVYANLNQDGSVDGIYVVNAYLLDKETDIVDYGKYDSVKNLTTDAEINKKGDTITTAAPEGKFFYQGNLKTKELPWVWINAAVCRPPGQLWAMWELPSSWCTILWRDRKKIL